VFSFIKVPPVGPLAGYRGRYLHLVFMRFPVAIVAVSSVIISGCADSGEPPPTPQITEGETKDRPTVNRPDSLVGIWRWQWSQGTVHHVILHADGRAEKYENADAIHTDGTWHVDEDGELVVSFSMHFRVDSESEIMDIETIPTDRDFPWVKVDRVSNSLVD
jgi:hypothetical protein